jgi:hypothetical protein
LESSPAKTLPRVFRDHLYLNGIESQIEDEEDGSFSIWVLDEDQRARATQLLEEFRAAPQVIDFRQAAAEARRKRESEEREERKRRSTVGRYRPDRLRAHGFRHADSHADRHRYLRGRRHLLPAGRRP